jgi:hypothetical protein
MSSRASHVRTLDYAQRPTCANLRGPSVMSQAVVSIAIGAACAALSTLLGQFGRSWSSALSVSWLALFTCPLACTAWTLRGSLDGRLLSGALLIAALVADLVILHATRAQGNAYFHLDWQSRPVVVIAWLALWSTWHAAALAGLVLPRRARNADGDLRAR